MSSQFQERAETIRKSICIIEKYKSLFKEDGTLLSSDEFLKNLLKESLILKQDIGALVTQYKELQQPKNSENHLQLLNSIFHLEAAITKSTILHHADMKPIDNQLILKQSIDSDFIIDLISQNEKEPLGYPLLISIYFVLYSFPILMKDIVSRLQEIPCKSFLMNWIHLFPEQFSKENDWISLFSPLFESNFISIIDHEIQLRQFESITPLPFNLSGGKIKGDDIETLYSSLNNIILPGYQASFSSIIDAVDSAFIYLWQSFHVADFANVKTSNFNQKLSYFESFKRSLQDPFDKLNNQEKYIHLISYIYKIRKQMIKRGNAFAAAAFVLSEETIASIKPCLRKKNPENLMPNCAKALNRLLLLGYDPPQISNVRVPHPVQLVSEFKLIKNQSIETLLPYYQKVDLLLKFSYSTEQKWQVQRSIIRDIFSMMSKYLYK